MFLIIVNKIRDRMLKMYFVYDPDIFGDNLFKSLIVQPFQSWKKEEEM